MSRPPSSISWDERTCPAGLSSRVGALRVGNGIGMTVRCAVDELPRYTCLDGGQADIGPSMQLICPSLEYLQRAYADAQRGYPAEARPGCYRLPQRWTQA